MATGRFAGPSSRPAASRSSSPEERRTTLDVDDTAVVVLALRRAGHDPTGAAGRGLQWMLGMQSRSGGFGAFDVDNESSLCARLAFCDFGAVTDPPSSDVTAHVLETLAHEGRAGEQAAVRALGWLLAEQERDGSWFGRWGANYLYGTGSALPALAACGLGGHESARAAVGWLERVQNPGGGFGEDLRSYRDRSWSGRGTSTASQTAWALLGLQAAGEGGAVTAQGAVQWLVETQRSDGGWDEQHFTRHRLPRRLLHQLPPLPRRVPGDGAGTRAGTTRMTALLVLVPMRIERIALGTPYRSAVIRTGMRTRPCAHRCGPRACARGLRARDRRPVRGRRPRTPCRRCSLRDRSRRRRRRVHACARQLARRRGAPPAGPPGSRRDACLREPGPRACRPRGASPARLSRSTWSRHGSRRAPPAGRSQSSGSWPTRRVAR